MIDKTDYMLVKIAEECAEVQKIVMKALRFGLEDRYVDGPTNLESLRDELIDLWVASDRIFIVLGFTRPTDEEWKKRVDRAAHFEAYSREKGRLA